MMIVRNLQICAAELDGEISLFEPVQAEYFNLNGAGAAIWNLHEHPTEVEQLLTALETLYDVDSSTCRQETEAFTAEALKRGMLREQARA